jgi:hypothetical protein
MCHRASFWLVGSLLELWWYSNELCQLSPEMSDSFSRYCATSPIPGRATALRWTHLSISLTIMTTASREQLPAAIAENLRARRRRARGAQLQGYHDGEPGKERRGEGRRRSRVAVTWRCFHEDVVLVELGISWE